VTTISEAEIQNIQDISGQSVSIDWDNIQSGEALTAYQQLSEENNVVGQGTGTGCLIWCLIASGGNGNGCRVGCTLSSRDFRYGK
jgi:hypothetical protein